VRRSGRWARLEQQWCRGRLGTDGHSGSPCVAT
jgi:hypothetical protein